MNDIRPLRIRSSRAADLQAWRAEYAQALSTGNAEAAYRVIEDLLVRRSSLSDIYMQVVTPSLVNIGDLWCREDISVAEEHLATQLVLTHLDRMIAMFAWHDRLSSYRILVGCVEGERHWVGARMFADLCLSHGWSAEFLGPDVPDDALVDIVKKRNPQVVALSATMTAGVEHVRSLVRALADLANAPRIIVGGHAIVEHAARQPFGAGCVIARDVIDGLDYAQQFLRAHRPKVVLKEYLSALGRRIRDLRLKKGWTQEQLAEGARVTRVCIVAVEGGKQNVSMDIVIRLANALGISPEGLMSHDRDANQTSGRTR